MNAAMERNVRLLMVFETSRYLLFWLPVFFLYFSSILPLEDVLLLEAVYYFGLVLLEVPSGWFSDRVGRRVTLLIAMAAQTVGGVLFVTTSSLLPFLVGQLCLAASEAFVSGTNNAMLYDSLSVVGREREIGAQSETMVSRGFLGLAISSLIGGVLAGFDMRIAYALAAAAGIAAFGLAWRMVEPAHPPAADESADRGQVSFFSVFGKLRDGTLLWVFAFAVAMTVFDHVPYEFLQPYIGFLTAGYGQGDYAPTPAVSGCLLCVMMLLASWSATRAMALSDRFGWGPALLLCMALQGAIIVGMMLVLHPAILLLIALRAVPMGLWYPMMNAIVQPKLDRGIRATYLSLQSLAGSLAFSGTLFLASWAVGDVATLNAELMSTVLMVYGIGVVVVLLALLAGIDKLHQD